MKHIAFVVKLQRAYRRRRAVHTAYSALRSSIGLPSTTGTCRPGLGSEKQLVGVLSPGSKKRPSDDLVNPMGDVHGITLGVVHVATSISKSFSAPRATKQKADRMIRQKKLCFDRWFTVWGDLIGFIIVALLLLINLVLHG